MLERARNKLQSVQHSSQGPRKSLSIHTLFSGPKESSCRGDTTTRIKGTLGSTLLGVYVFEQHLLYHSKMKGLTNAYPVVDLQVDHPNRLQISHLSQCITLAMMCKIRGKII